MPPKAKKQKKSGGETILVTNLGGFVNRNMFMATQNNAIEIDNVMTQTIATIAQCSSLNVRQTSPQTLSNQLSSADNANACQQQQQLAIYSGMDESEDESIEDADQFASIRVNCLSCHHVIEQYSQAINCETCESWYHLICVGVTPQSVRMFGADQRFKWLCNKCAVSCPSKSFINIT